MTIHFIQMFYLHTVNIMSCPKRITQKLFHIESWNKLLYPHWIAHEDSRKVIIVNLLSARCIEKCFKRTDTKWRENPQAFTENHVVLSLTRLQISCLISWFRTKEALHWYVARPCFEQNIYLKIYVIVEKPKMGFVMLF